MTRYLLTPIDLACHAANSSGSAAIVLDIRMTDGDSIERLPDCIDAQTATALFRGPQVITFDSTSEAVDHFNELVEETLSKPMNLDYVISLTNGIERATVHSNIPGMGDPDGHPVCTMDGDEGWITEHPSES